jgi:hypothetical protein
VVTPDALLLFEILDDPPSLSFRVSANQNDRVDAAKKYHKLAWAFLLPVGQSGTGEPPRLLPSTLSPSLIVNVGFHQPPPPAVRKSKPRKPEEKSSSDTKGEKGEGEEREDSGDHLEQRQQQQREGDYDLPLRLQLYQYQ